VVPSNADGRHTTRGMASDLLFQSGCRDLNPGPLDPQSLKGGILR